MNPAWPMVLLEEVLMAVSRGEKVDPNKEYDLLGAHWYAMGLYIKETKSGSQIRASKLYRVEEGDFVYNRLFAWKGSFAIATSGNHGCYVSNEFPCFTVNIKRLDPQYLWRYFNLATTWNEALGLSSGGTPTSRNRLKEKQLLGMKIPLPPLPEQRRIVAKIEKLADKVNEVYKCRQKAMYKTKSLVATTRLQVFGQALTKGWKVEKLDKVAPINMGQSPPGASYNSLGAGIPLLNGPTEFGVHYPTAVQWTTVPTKLCKADDILLCVRGATTGKMNWADKEYCIGRGLAALTVDSDSCDPRYVYHFVQSQTQHMLSLAAGSTFPNLPGAKLKKLDIPLPTLAEQRRIVAYLDGLQAKIDSLKQLQAKTKAELDALLPSILDKAFKGEL